MVELTFHQSSVDDERTVEGTVTQDENGRSVLETHHENRPNFRVDGDSVTLLSANTDVEIEDFGLNPRFDGYCTQHGVVVERIAGHDRCPRCRMVDDVRAREHELMQRRSNPDMHPSADARRR